MFLIIKVRKSILIAAVLAFIILIFTFSSMHFGKSVPATHIEDELVEIIEQIIKTRNEAILNNDKDTLAELFNKKSQYAVWAYEHEVKRLNYLHNWEDKQGIAFVDIKTNISVRYTKPKGSGFSSNFLASTEYRYIYKNDESETENIFRIGTYHSLDVIEQDGKWVINKEWYTDPFADSLNLDNIKSDVISNYITSHPARDLSNISDRRKAAVAYADKYCGAASDGSNGYQYNKKYKDYNPLGGDCANFASQIMHEGGNFKKTYTWNYDKDGSKAWVNAQAFKDYWLNSGRASLIAYGSYEKVYKASYKMLPGDFIAYEKDGKVTHISVVTGADSKGYTLVNCHNTDRYRVPWDLGWSNKEIKFYLIHTHF